jgi:argininosuccinate synthase
LKAPKLKVLTPIRDLGWTRKEEAEYAKKHKIPLPKGYEREQYAVDTNLYGRAVCGGLLDNNAEPEEEIYELTSSPENALDEPAIVKIGFVEGCPTKLNGKKLGGVELIEDLSKIAGLHGVGRGDVIHERMLGIKSRSIIEAPAPAVLIPSHRELESLVLTGDELEFKQNVERRLSRLVHNGLWFDPLKEDLFAFVNKTQERVTGEVSAKLYKGTVRVVARESSYAISESYKALRRVK